LTETKLKQI